MLTGVSYKSFSFIKYQCFVNIFSLFKTYYFFRFIFWVMMLSSNIILVTALFLLLSSSTVMSATPTREGAQKEENNYECDVIRMLLEKASGAEQLLDNSPKIQRLFADGLVVVKAKFRLT